MQDTSRLNRLETDSMSEPVALPAGPAVTSCWVAVFALGLAYSQRPEHELVRELQAVTVNRPWLLGAARDQLASRVVAEPALCREAVRLLSRADDSAPMFCG